jgi:phage-related protein (TIGR01555 family)
MRSNAIARKVVSKQVHLAYGTGVDYTATGGLDGAGDVFKDERRRLELESKVKQARTLGRAFGGALLIMSIDDGLNPSEPLDLSKVRQLLYLRAVDRWSVTRTEYDLTGGPRDGEPTIYTVTSASGSAVRIHHTRCIRFEGLETDAQTRASLSGWTDSVLQLVYDEIRDIDAGGQSLSVQLQSAVQTVFKIKNLHEQILASNREFVENWIQSVEMFRSNFRAIGLDADNESIEFLSRPLADSVKVYEQLQTRVAAATSMPVSELFGQAPAGLSTDDLSGTRRFYDTIESEEQRGAQGQALESILRIIAAQSATPAIQGATLGFVWPSLYSPTSKEKAELDKIKAETVAILNGTGDLQAGDYRDAAAAMLGLDLDTSDIAPVAVGDSYGPLLVSRLSKLFAQQAARLARGQAQISYGKVKQHVLRATRGLPSGDQAQLQAYFKEQWEALPGDIATFKAVRESRGEEPQPADIIALVKTRTRLRTKHLGNRLDQAHNRADMSKAGSTSFVWTTRGDSVVRPEHKELDGQVFPLASGAPTVGFPGDPPGCRCVARPVPNSAALGETQ